MQKGVYFDFLGTLWLTHPSEEQFQNTSQEVCYLGLFKNEAEVRTMVRRLGGMPAPGVCRVLPAIGKLCPLVLVSQSPALVLRQALESWCLMSCFQVIVSTQEHHETKAQAVERVRRAYQIDPIVYLGDSYSDGLMAHSLHIDYVHIGTLEEYEKSLGFKITDSCYVDFLQAMQDVLEKVRKALGILKFFLDTEGNLVQVDEKGIQKIVQTKPKKASIQDLLE